MSLACAVIAGVQALRSGGTKGLARPALTVLCFSVIAVVSVVQLAMVPGLLRLLMRDGVGAAGRQPWRMVTSLLVQDGGWSGAAFNLAGLFAAGSVAERLLGRRRWIAVGCVSVAVAQTVALFWQPAGAGNSILDCGLAGGVCAACATNRPARQVLMPAIVAIGGFVILVALRDIHGVAALTGAGVQSAALRRVSEGPEGP